MKRHECSWKEGFPGYKACFCRDATRLGVAARDIHYFANPPVIGSSLKVTLFPRRRTVHGASVSWAEFWPSFEGYLAREFDLLRSESAR